MSVFQPVTLTPGDDPSDVIVVDIRPMAGDDGVTFITWDTSGGVYDARVFFRSRATFHDGGVVGHELMHALGFGHTSAWPSLMSPDPRGHRLSAEDVAYMQVALKSRAESERVDTWDRIALAVERSSPSPAAPPEQELCVPFSEMAFGRSDATRLRENPGMTLVGIVVACNARPKLPLVVTH